MLWPDGSKTKPYVSSAFGPRKAPIAGASTNHKGTDFSNTFSLIRAVAAGRVVAINLWPALGYSVWIQHDGFFSKSGHMKSQPAVKVGEDVTEGRIVGVMGKTGTATDTHLHFEITPGSFHTSNTGQVDPVPFIANRIAGTSGGGTSTPGGFLMALNDEQQQQIYEVISDIGVALGSAGARNIPPAERTQRSVLANLVAAAGGIANLQTMVANMNAWISEGGPGVAKGTAKPGTIAARVTNLDRQLTGADGQRVNLVQHVLDIKKIVEAGGVTEGQANAIAEAVAKQLGLDPDVIAKAVNDDAARRMTS